MPGEVLYKPLSPFISLKLLPHSSFSHFFAHSHYPDAKDNSFTRSRSSSVTSIDRESREAISSFHFCESYPRKMDSQVSPCLLVGTTQGTVMTVALSLPPGADQRLQQPVGISSCGKINWTWNNLLGRDSHVTGDTEKYTNISQNWNNSTRTYLLQQSHHSKPLKITLSEQT